MVLAPMISAKSDTAIFAGSCGRPRSTNRQGRRRALRTVGIRTRLCRLLFLPEDLRRARIGSRVLAIAEEEGRRRGCTRITLTTLSVEAPGFYKKQGYDVAATIDCDPPGLTRYYMMKKL